MVQSYLIYHFVLIDFKMKYPLTTGQYGIVIIPLMWSVVPMLDLADRHNWNALA